ncbi:MAG: SDR family NAD(P)-dependent oxidoreductase [Myxococcales bacterium]|nr:SDR family NAD(P)-dependent oxidoreductase [Myxococcales bacterium]
MRSLQNRVAVVTGAASGIGRETALALAREGCDLAVADVDEAGLAATAEAITALGRKASTHVVDVASRERMQAFVAEVVDAHGRVHIVVNNAGVSVTATLADHSLDDFEWIVGVNFWGVVHGCKLFLPELQRAGWGAFVNISSMFGLIGLPTQSSYCATKFAVRGFSEALAAELVHENIDVISVHPGGIATNIVRNARFTDKQAQARAVEFFRKVMPPEKAAAEIVAGIKHRRRRVLITSEAKATDVIKRLYPDLPPKLIRWAQRKIG